MGCGASASKEAEPQPHQEIGGKHFYNVPQVEPVDEQRKRFAKLDEARTKYRYDWSAAEFPPWADWSDNNEVDPVEGNPDGTTLELISIQTKMTLSKLESKKNDWMTFDTNEPFQRIDQIWTGSDRPSVSKRFKTDEEFGRQRLAGMMPTELRKCDGAAPPNMAVTDELVSDVIAKYVAGGKSPEALAKENRLYYTSQPQLEGLETKEGCFLAAPIVLFVVADDKKLYPVAIQPYQDAAKAPCFPAPTEKNGVSEGTWLGLKIHANVADFFVHGNYLHAVKMHMVMESLWLAARRNLSEQHPLLQFLKPHFFVTVFINKPIRSTFAPDGDIITIAGTTHAGTWEGMKRLYKETFDWRDYEQPTYFERRGTKNLEGYLYKDHSLQMWDILSAYCAEMAKIWYPADAAVAEDYELQNWFRELRSEVECGICSLPEITTLDELIRFLTSVLFCVSARHSYVENSALDYYAYSPNQPASFRMPIPTDLKQETTLNQVSDYLPGLDNVILQRALIDSVRLHAAEFYPLGAYAKTPGEAKKSVFMQDEPQAKRAVANFREALKKKDEEMKKWNAEREKNNLVPFPYFEPSRLFSSVWN